VKRSGSLRSWWGTKRQCDAGGYVPVDYGGDGFPLFGDEVSPW
jgi:hypothetical protein